MSVLVGLQSGRCAAAYPIHAPLQGREAVAVRCDCLGGAKARGEAGPF